MSPLQTHKVAQVQEPEASSTPSWEFPAAPGLSGTQLVPNLGSPTQLSENVPALVHCPLLRGRESSKPGRHLRGAGLSATAEELSSPR